MSKLLQHQCETPLLNFGRLITSNLALTFCSKTKNTSINKIHLRTLTLNRRLLISTTRLQGAWKNL